MIRTIVLRLLLRLVAIAIAVGVLYGLVLTERVLVAILPAGAGTWWMEHPDVQPFVDIPIALAVLAGVVFALDVATRKLGLSPPAKAPRR